MSYNPELEAAMAEVKRKVKQHGHQPDIADYVEVIQPLIEQAEQRGYLRGLHDAWHNVHIRRFDRHGGPWVEGSSPHAVDTYYSGVISSQHIIGELWHQTGRTDPIGGNVYEEFPVTDLNTAKNPTATD